MRVGVYAGAMLIAWSGALAVAQMKVTTPEEYDKAMKPAGAAMRNDREGRRVWRVRGCQERAARPESGGR